MEWVLLYTFTLLVILGLAFLAFFIAKKSVSAAKNI